MTLKVKVEFDKISDRQDLILVMETRRLGLEPYMMDRDDMYWARVHITDDGLVADLNYSVDTPNLRNDDWSFSFQYGPDLLDTASIREKIRTAWNRSIEKACAVGWLKNLIEAGYYDHGCFGAPNANTGQCPHCERMFEKGTSHPHTYLVDWNHKGEKKMIYHHKLMEKTIKEKGLTRIGRSALPDIPSLEEIGELESVTIS